MFPVPNRTRPGRGGFQAPSGVAARATIPARAQTTVVFWAMCRAPESRPGRDPCALRPAGNPRHRRPGRFPSIADPVISKIPIATWDPRGNKRMAGRKIRPMPPRTKPLPSATVQSITNLPRGPGRPFPTAPWWWRWLTARGSPGPRCNAWFLQRRWGAPAAHFRKGVPRLSFFFPGFFGLAVWPAKNQFRKPLRECGPWGIKASRKSKTTIPRTLLPAHRKIRAPPRPKSPLWPGIRRPPRFCFACVKKQK